MTKDAGGAISLRECVGEEFRRRFAAPPRFFVRAPGRVNLIGEHTDYNEGFVLPMAISRDTWIALGPRADSRVVLHSLAHEEAVNFDLAALNHQGQHWGEYIKGVAWALLQDGHRLLGWEGVVGSDVPMGAGLSSSASFELAVARAFQAVSGFGWDAVLMARLCQRAESQWVGVNCGIMDQMICACAKAGHALLIDCRSFQTTQVLLPRETAVVVMDTGTRRGLLESAYNERRASCESAARSLGVRALREVSVGEFEELADRLDAVTRRRVRHVLTENERTQITARTADPITVGQLMNASHASLRDDFEVVNEELNVMVDSARGIPGCYGARMTGAGFGGCAVALVRAEMADRFANRVGQLYFETTGLPASIYVCEPGNGAEGITP